MENSLTKVNHQQELMSAPAQSSQKLLQCLIRLETDGLSEEEARIQKSQAKMDLMLMSHDLMPGGKPNILGVIKYPMIRDLVATEGRRKMLAVLVLLIKDFCSSMNVVRNMNEEQMIDAGGMLLQECGNFRLEDYVMMFSLAKKGELVKIYDRIDIQIITQILDEYWKRRNQEGESFQEAASTRLDSLGSTIRRKDQMDGYELREQGMQDSIGRISAGLNELKNSLKEQNQKGGTP